MSLVLHVQLRAPADDLDPATALGDLRSVLNLLRDMEESLARDENFDATAWRFESITAGSLNAAFRPAGTKSRARDRAAALRLVDGFRDAEADTLIPEEWSLKSARRAKNIAGHLGDDADRGLHLRLVVDGEDQASATVTAAAAENLRTATRATHDSIGSVVGSLGSVSVHSHNTAGLWPERGPRVSVSFPADRFNDVRAALGQPRVLVGGLLQRNSRGQLLNVKMRRLEVLPGPDPDRPAGLTRTWPGMTGDVDAVTYVRRMRDSS